MAIPEYEYPIEQCDVPEARRKVLREYRLFRRKCLDFLRGPADTAVATQIHDLAWHTVVFRTLNEARRIEPERAVNGGMWELITAGYATIMAMGIRRLVDKDSQTDSVWNLIAQVEKRPELLTRENFVCYDGIRFDYQEAVEQYVQSLDKSIGASSTWLPTTGPQAWGTSQMLHKAFDDLAGPSKKRKRTDVIQPVIISNLKAQLNHPSIKKVCTMADKVVAHAERFAENGKSAPTTTYLEIDDALRIIVQVTNFLSSIFFYDAAFGSVVPTPQFDVLEALDQPWVTAENLPKLQEHWHELSEAMDRWTYDPGAEILPNCLSDQS